MQGYCLSRMFDSSKSNVKVTLHYWDMHKDVPLVKPCATVEEGLSAMYKAKAKGHYNVKLKVNDKVVAR